MCPREGIGGGICQRRRLMSRLIPTVDARLGRRLLLTACVTRIISTIAIIATVAAIIAAAITVVATAAIAAVAIIAVVAVSTCAAIVTD